MDHGVIAAALALAMLVGPGVVGAAPPPPPRLPAPHTLRISAELPPMQRHADGSLRHVDTDARFVGIVHSDGRVELRDLPGTTVKIQTPFNTVNWMVGMAQAIERPERHDRPELETPMPDRDDTVARTEAATEKIDHGPYGPPAILMGVSFGFGGIADLMLRRGQRKRTRAKQAFLERTAPLREAMARERSRAQQRAALLSLGQQLAAMWRDESRTVARRKRELFERWDDCEEAQPGDSETDAQQAEGATQMRRHIERFVRRTAPPGSTMAFSDEDLVRLNSGRVSRQRFDPYAIPNQDARDDPEPGIVAR